MGFLPPGLQGQQAGIAPEGDGLDLLAQQLREVFLDLVGVGQAVDQAHRAGRWFVPQRVSDYSPEPGDLICSSRGPRRPGTINGYTSSRMLTNTNTHCDLVVANPAVKPDNRFLRAAEAAGIPVTSEIRLLVAFRRR